MDQKDQENNEERSGLRNNEQSPDRKPGKEVDNKIRKAWIYIKLISDKSKRNTIRYNQITQRAIK